MSKRKLLLADDSVTIQKVVNLTFADEGIEVIAVGDGDTAMLKFVESIPDLVMVDVNMPGIDGYRICEMIKQDEETRHIPVILLVGSFEPFDEAEAHRVGADDFLTKPFQSIRQLVNKVSDLLNVKSNEADFSFPIETAATVNSFDDTLEMKLGGEPSISEPPTENLGDAGMDDEMIQTAQVGSLPIDETIKYESEPISELDSEPIYEAFSADIHSPEPSNDFENSVAESVQDSTETENDLTETDESLMENEFVPGDSFPESVTVAEKKKFLPPFDFNDFDLLDFPKAEQSAVLDEINSPTNSESLGEMSDENKNTLTEISETDAAATFETSVEKAKTAESSVQMGSFSPELIEAIADRVVEKLSTEVIKEIVREVIAQTERKT
ncbi:MAG: response regulator [Pyrinomonadaceae bacterium]|nr:response regulator [Pyrinomonadaceae bacterium]